MRMSLVLNAWAYIWDMTSKPSGLPNNAANPHDTFYVHARQLVSPSAYLNAIFPS